MVNSSIENIREYPAVRNSVRSGWILVLFALPLVLFALYLIYADRLVPYVSILFTWKGGKSTAFYKDLLNLVFTEILWLDFFILLTWFFVVYVPAFQAVQKLESQSMANASVTATGILFFSFAASVLVAYNVLEAFPNSSDEYAYLYQAESMSRGRLWENAHDLPAFFQYNHIAQKEGISVSRFPPGWPLFLIPAFYLGIPPVLVNPVLGLIALLVFYKFANRFYGARVALWSLAALALTSFYIFNSASFFSHTSCLLVTVGFVYALSLYFEEGKIHHAVFAGFFLGLLLIIRYYTAVLFFFPFALFILYRYKVRSILVFLLIGTGTLPCLLFLFWYNQSITGNPFLPVTMWGYDDESLGFVRGHTVEKGFEHLGRWGLMFLYWCSPALLVLYGIFLWEKIRNRTEWMTKPEDYFVIFLAIGYFFYYEIGGNQYGPRFFFEALPFVIVFVVSKLLRHPRRWMVALFHAGMVYAVLKIPFIAVREHRVIEERKDIYYQVEANHLTNAVVFVAAATGVIRPMPVGDLTRNDVHFENDVLYVHEIPGKNELLLQYYPDRKFYRYVRGMGNVHGKLIRIR